MEEQDLLREPLAAHEPGEPGRGLVDLAGGDVAEIAAAVLPAQHVDPADWIAYEQSLAVLSPEHRSLVLMRFEFGMSFGEIAAELGETADGVRMKLNRAIARMAGAADDRDA